MKFPLFAALSMFSLFASAGDKTEASNPPTAQSGYDYSQDLDIAKIVRSSNANSSAKACGPVKTQLEYTDSKGQTRKLEYTRFGDSCQHG